MSSYHANRQGFIELFALDARGISSAEGLPGTLLHFTNEVPVTVGEQIYQALPVEIEAVSFDPSQAPAQPILRISALTPTMRALIYTYGNLIGARLHLSRIFADALLAGGQGALDPAQVFATSTWSLDRLAALDSQTARWILRGDLDREDLQVPRRALSRDFCPFTTRRWNGQAFDYTGVQCPYQGAAIYDASGALVQDPSQEHFSRTLSDCCKRRFSARELPFGGFPGVERR